MPRTKGSQDIRGWRYHGLIRDLAANDLHAEELAEKYGVEADTVYHFRERHKAEVAAVLADWSDEFSDLWSVKKHNRIADLEGLLNGIHERMGELLEEAERATEEMRIFDPNAAKVLVHGPEWRGYVREAARLEHQIADEMGQLPSRNPADTAPVTNPITVYDVLVEDADGHLHAVAPVQQ
jgi:hypothetical protein